MEWKTAGEALLASPNSAALWAPGRAGPLAFVGEAIWEWGEVWPCYTVKYFVLSDILCGWDSQGF